MAGSIRSASIRLDNVSMEELDNSLAPGEYTKSCHTDRLVDNVRGVVAAWVGIASVMTTSGAFN